MERFPSQSGEKLVNLFIKSAHRLHALLYQRAKEWVDGIKDRKSLEAVARRIGDSAATLYSYLEYIEAFCFERTRSEVILPFEFLMKARFPESSNDIFIFYPQWEFNFSYLNLKNELKTILFFVNEEEANDFFKHMPNRIAVISFPVIERDNILALVILAHELAHYFDIDPDNPEYRISRSPDVVKAVSIPETKVKSWIEVARKLDPASDQWPPLLAEIYYSTRINEKLFISIRYWLRELTADITAARFFGIGFYLSAKELFSLVPRPPDSPYPPNYTRLAEIASEINGSEGGFEKDLLERTKNKLTPAENTILKRIYEMTRSDSELANTNVVNYIKPDMDKPKLTSEQRKEILDKMALSIIEESISNALDILREKIRRKIPEKNCLRFTEKIFLGAKYLKSRIPPCEILGKQPIEKPEVFDIREILNATWLYWMDIIERIKSENKELFDFQKDLESYYNELNILCRHSLRAIELSNFSQLHKPKENGNKKAYVEHNSLLSKDFNIPRTGVLGKREIVKLMMVEDLDKSLIITPLLDQCQIAGASVDLTLGNVFIVMRRTRLESLNFREICEKDEKVNVYEFQERIQLRPDGEIVLHPNEFVLGSTLEYISLPPDVMAYVIGKSSFGRVGLVIATATHVAPGFKGTITLELSNLGSIPIVLYTTMPIAQLVFHKVCSAVDRGYSATGFYAYSTGPEFSKYLLRKRST